MTQSAFRALRPARNKFVASFVFVREWLRSPRAIGMVCPSGHALARAMAAAVPLAPTEIPPMRPTPTSPKTFAKTKADFSQPDIPRCSNADLVVELGAGTGTVTAELLKHGVCPQRLLVLERAQGMVELLRMRFPGLRIIHGDAAHLSLYLPPNARVSCVISSLPLVSLPDEVRLSIIKELRLVLGANGQMIQYTYSWGRHFILEREGFHCTTSRRVWRNLPPAKVMRFINPSRLSGPVDPPHA